MLLSEPPQRETDTGLTCLLILAQYYDLPADGLQATRELDLARERYVVITAASYSELTNGLTSAARGRENLVNALFRLNAARVNLARATGSLNTLK